MSTSAVIDPNAVLQLQARIPSELAPLARIAFNYAWSWHLDGESLFHDLDPELWAASNHNPLRVLVETSRLEHARSTDIPARAAAVLAAIDADCAAPVVAQGEACAERPIAYFAAEFGVHGSLPIYSGGLGVLAGDYLKAASDRRLPVVGIGLYYQWGYFHQRLDLTGLQHEYWRRMRHEQLPMRAVHGANGAPLTVAIMLRGRRVALRIWLVQVGRVPLFLLDSNVEGNGPVERFITSQVYVADREMRLMQYAVLGIGGVRALAALGITPSIYHLNEGHSAFAGLELARMRRHEHATLRDAIADVRRGIVFTTHTPVPAGNESYETAEVSRVLADLAQGLGASDDELLGLGRQSDAPNARFGMTELALNVSRSVNAVSTRHGEVARAMWRGFYSAARAEDVPITHVTNGVHLGTWMANGMRRLLRRFLGEDWELRQDDARVWAAIQEIPDDALWQVRCEARAALTEAVRLRSVADRLERGEHIEYVEAAARSFQPDVLTVGFARRVATYKRLHLLTEAPERALRLLGSDRPIQVVVAGKAHPADSDAKRSVQTIFAVRQAPIVGMRVAFLEDYDLEVASLMVAGCDVWVNLPRPPNEASGTSGMKCALNGGLNLSVFDGWWCEGFGRDNGWVIHSSSALSPDEQDHADATRLYDTLEQHVVPAFYERDARDLPQRWLQYVRNSLMSIGPRFNGARMLRDYANSVYAR